MLRIVAWHRWQGGVIHAALRSRLHRAKDRREPGDDAFHRPLALSQLSVAAQFDADFLRFAERLGRPDADALFLRVLQAAATSQAMLGDVTAPRSHFGATVLARPWHLVSAKVGCEVYDALLASGLAVEVGSEHPSCDDTQHATRCDTCNAMRTRARVRSSFRSVLPLSSPPHDAASTADPDDGPRNGRAQTPPSHCPRHGRDLPCSVCDAVAPPLDPAGAEAARTRAVDAILAKAGVRRPAETPPAVT